MKKEKKQAEQKFWDDVNKAFKKLKLNKRLWREELEERKLWGITFLDNYK